MSSETVKANLLVLDDSCSLYFNGRNGFVPMGRYSVGSLLMAMDTVAADFVLVEFRTTSDPKVQEADKRKHSKRLESLFPAYARGPWKNREIRGNVFPNVFECELNRQVRSGS